MSAEEKAEALAKRLSEAAIDAYNSVDDQYVAPMLQAAADELLPFASALVRLAAAAKNAIDSAITDADCCPFCDRDVRVCSEGCPVEVMRSALREYEKLEGK